MSIYRARDYHEEYRSTAAAGDVPMLDGVVDRTVPDFDAGKILRLVPAPALGSVADIGCGSATLLRTMADDDALTSCSLRGVLPSPEEVTLTRQLCSSRPQWSRIEISLGDATSTGLPSASQDRVYMNQMFHYLSDESAPRALSEAHRILREGGMLYIGALPDQDEFSHLKQDDTAWSWFTANALHATSIREAGLATARVLRYAVTRRAFVQRLRTPFHCRPAEFRTLLEAAGFKNVTISRYTLLDQSGAEVDHRYRWDYTASR